MKQRYGTDNAAPCWFCSATVAEYVTDDTVSLIDVTCKCCNRTDVFMALDDFPTTAAECSAAHRKRGSKR